MDARVEVISSVLTASQNFMRQQEVGCNLVCHLLFYFWSFLFALLTVWQLFNVNITGKVIYLF